jgi:spermidine/putrescine transport system permease protein
MRRHFSLSLLLAFLAVIYLPLFVVALLSFNSSTLTTEWRGFTLHWYQAAFFDGALRAAVLNSMKVAVAATVVSLLLGSMAAFSVQYRCHANTSIEDATLRVPLLVPDVAIAVALGMFFHVIDFGQSVASVVLAHSAWGLSIVYLVVRSNLASIPRGLRLAAADSGGNTWQVAFHIDLPLAVPGIAGSSLLVFALSLGDFTYALFCAGPGSTTLPVFLYSSLKFRFTPVVYSSFTALFGFTLSLLVTALIGLRGVLAKLAATETDHT